MLYVCVFARLQGGPLGGCSVSLSPYMCVTVPAGTPVLITTRNGATVKLVETAAFVACPVSCSASALPAAVALLSSSANVSGDACPLCRCVFVFVDSFLVLPPSVFVTVITVVCDVECMCVFVRVLRLYVRVSMNVCVCLCVAVCLSVTCACVCAVDSGGAEPSGQRRSVVIRQPHRRPLLTLLRPNLQH